MGRPPQDVKRLARKLLDRFQITQPPVLVADIARYLNIQVVYTHFSDNPRLSGMLMRQPDRIVMGINSAQGNNRQRFTIAHELGHFFLDPAKPVWIDNGVGSAQVSYRLDSGSPSMYELEEVRANKFAAALLMPEAWLRRDFEYEHEKDDVWADEDALAKSLADRYRVSLQAMVIRLLELGLIGPQASP